MLLFFCEREWMRYRVRKPRFAPPNSNGAVVHFAYNYTTQCSVLLFIYKLSNAEAIHLFRKIAVSFFV